uniref:Mitochondrial basic amino acids transporter n=1 Tax=Phallusia mammillata TaxID=59560 RepID=A0A6F9DT71_9ASCI|nr:mitochondrial basic amino acids transporter [Phallusia mammillata]
MGVAGVLVGQPFDTIKVRLQTQPGKYRGIWNCFTTIVKQETVHGLFKGMSSPLLGLSLINAIVFGVQAQTIAAFGRETTFTHFASGAFAGAVQSVICSPMELAKTKMQVQGIGTKVVKDKVVYSSSVDVLRKTFRAEGLKGCYRGMLITLIRETPAFGSYFASYDILTSVVFKFETSQMYKKEGIMKMLTAGGLSGMVSWAITYPADVIKSRIQADGTGGRPYKYSGIMDCARQMQKKEGSGVFFRGITSTLLRAFPVNAATFTVVHLCTQYFVSHHN